jgi:Arc/MetJ-type ribon-helix-helix transcriptional regulator
VNNVLRSSGQKLISVPMNEKFIDAVDKALPKVGFSDRSSFIRAAIVEKLTKAGVKISVELSLAPSRTGKGGRPPLKAKKVVGTKKKTTGKKK